MLAGPGEYLRKLFRQWERRLERSRRNCAASGSQSGAQWRFCLYRQGQPEVTLWGLEP